jgi:hypothetical protein
LSLSIDGASPDPGRRPSCQHLGMGTDVISLVLSLVALTAAAASLALQARGLFTSRHQGIHSAQLELVRMAVDDPVLYLGYEPTEEQRIRFKHHGYVNIFVKYFELGFLTGAFGETEVRHQMRELFAGAGPRAAWPAVRTAWRAGATNRRKERFVDLVEQEFEQASRTPPTNDNDGPGGA